MKKGLWQPQEIHRGRRESRKRNQIHQGTWLDGARIGSLWLCYAGPLAEKQKVGCKVVGENQCRLLRGRGTVREVRRGEDEEE